MATVVISNVVIKGLNVYNLREWLAIRHGYYCTVLSDCKDFKKLSHKDFKKISNKNLYIQC